MSMEGNKNTSGSALKRKKIKLRGYPLVIIKKIAFIEGMFTSDLEIDRFVGEPVSTESGIQGKVLKAAKDVKIDNLLKKKRGLPEEEPEEEPEKEFNEGIVMCTFTERISIRDIVTLRVWTQVEVPPVFNPLTTSLQACDQTRKGKETVAELKRGHNLDIPVNNDSSNKPIERKKRKIDPDMTDDDESDLDLESE